MSQNDKHKVNHSAFRRMQDEINRRFPAEHFVAFDGGRIVADAPTYEALSESLAAIGKDHSDILVVQAGVDYPESATILVASVAR